MKAGRGTHIWAISYSFKHTLVFIRCWLRSRELSLIYIEVPANLGLQTLLNPFNWNVLKGRIISQNCSVGLLLLLLLLGERVEALVGSSGEHIERLCLCEGRCLFRPSSSHDTPNRLTWSLHVDLRGVLNLKRLSSIVLGVPERIRRILLGLIAHQEIIEKLLRLRQPLRRLFFNTWGIAWICLVHLDDFAWLTTLVGGSCTMRPHHNLLELL